MTQAKRLERFRRLVDNSPLLSDLNIDESGRSDDDTQVLWQSIDYSSLCTPDPLMSPRTDGIPAMFLTADQFFEIDTEGYFGMLENTMILPGTEHTNLPQ